MSTKPYIIVSEPSISGLEDTVGWKIKDDYEPSGGMTIDKITSETEAGPKVETRYCQAMVKRLRRG